MALPDAEGPERLISPPPPAAADTLPFQINAGTRSIHTELNRLITARLPLALPPNTDTPTLYLHGINAFAQLYFAFEDAWQDLICAHLSASRPAPIPTAETTGPPSPAEAALFPTDDDDDDDDALRTFLATLVPPQLWRTQRLERDILSLATRHGVVLPNANADPLVATIAAHVGDAAAEKPHVLLAYGWVLYMAIFSGGRWVRGQLVGAGEGFWAGGRRESGEGLGIEVGGEGEKEEGMREQEGVGLFFFDSEVDGEDVKAEFKGRFARADALLDDVEKAEVVEEARRIFEMCIEMVRALDRRLGTPEGTFGAAVVEDSQESVKAGNGNAKIEKENTMAERMAKYMPPRDLPNPTLYPGTYMTKGLNPFATMMAIALGIGAWYMMHSLGLLGHGVSRV